MGQFHIIGEEKTICLNFVGKVVHKQGKEQWWEDATLRRSRAQVVQSEQLPLTITFVFDCPNMMKSNSGLDQKFGMSVSACRSKVYDWRSETPQSSQCIWHRFDGQKKYNPTPFLEEKVNLFYKSDGEWIHVINRSEQVLRHRYHIRPYYGRWLLLVTIALITW